ncbi:MAG: tRNA (N6-isopentenyl adenosine(37)-C2)-methylthiotransferase MiaB [Pelagibacteraceae bacterium TMED216]|nr:MAG: tRNA (N6-isopentenyl adenosine(37)-C2)-methylthiotransferase MiaB [Pelagibacteraceae bacterium TMED216]
MNEYDSDRIIDLLSADGYQKTDISGEADCYIINTCHIREKANEKVFHDIGRVKKEFRNKKKPILIVAGCVAQAEGNILLEKEKYIDAVIGPQSYQNIIKTIKDIVNKKKNKIETTEFDVVQKFDTLNNIKRISNKVSSFLTIQEGCDKFCKFCVVPYTRGPEYSRSFKEIINEAKDLISSGAKEIILIGQNVNAYSRKNKNLSDLIYKLEEIKSLKRIRYTTSHPIDMSDDLINIYKFSSKLMPLLHLPVQSGSTKILKLMNRKHTIENYYEIIDKLRKANSKIEFSSDFIIGYPEETEEDFNKTMKLMSDIKFINSFSFIFSPRPGTPASKMRFVDREKALIRLKKFQKLSDRIKFNYKNNLLGKTVKVLIENKLRDQNKYFGKDEHSNPVIIDSAMNLTGREVKINVTNFNLNTLFGKQVRKEKEDQAA